MFHACASIRADDIGLEGVLGECKDNPLDAVVTQNRANKGALGLNVTDGHSRWDEFWKNSLAKWGH